MAPSTTTTNSSQTDAASLCADDADEQVFSSDHDIPAKDYFVVLLNKRIKKCYGCGQDFPKKVDGTILSPPNDIVIMHKDRREYMKNGKNVNPYSQLPSVYFLHQEKEQ